MWEGGESNTCNCTCTHMKLTSIQFSSGDKRTAFTTLGCHDHLNNGSYQTYTHINMQCSCTCMYNVHACMRRVR